MLKILNIYLFCSRICITGLLFAEQRAIHRVVLLQLHSLHLLLDRVHGGGLVCSLVYQKKDNVSGTATDVSIIILTFSNMRSLEHVNRISSHTLLSSIGKLYFLILPWCPVRITRSIPKENDRVRARSSCRRFQ